MELKHLRTILAVQKQGGFTRAARSLGVTQAAVSQQVAALEEELGVSLFDRRGKQVSPTPAGAKLCEDARGILQMVDEAISNIAESELKVSGILRIAASTVPAATIVPKLLRDFSKEFPNVRPEIDVSESRTAAQAVERGEADVGFVGEKPSTGKLQSRVIAEDQLVFVVGRGHSLAGRKSISLTQLADTPLIVREPNSGSRRCLAEALAEQGSSLEAMSIAMEVNSQAAILAAVRESAGAAFLSAETIRKEIESGQVRAITVRKLKPRRSLFVIHPALGQPQQPLRAFLDFLQDR